MFRAPVDSGIGQVNGIYFMKSYLLIVITIIFFPNTGSPDWLQDIRAIHQELDSLTRNEQRVGDQQRLQRFYQLSYDLAILEFEDRDVHQSEPRC